MKKKSKRVDIHMFHFDSENFVYVDNVNCRLTVGCSEGVYADVWRKTELESMPSFDQVILAAKTYYLANRLLPLSRLHVVDVGHTSRVLREHAVELRLQKTISGKELQGLLKEPILESSSPLGEGWCAPRFDEHGIATAEHFKYIPSVLLNEFTHNIGAAKLGLLKEIG